MDLSIAGCLPWEAGDLTIEDVANLLRRPAWQADGACREHPDVNWFPALGQSGAPAKAVCGGCLVVDACRDWALSQGRLDGIWGGLSEHERSATRRGGTTQPARTVRVRATPPAKRVPLAREERLARIVELRADGARVDDIAQELGVHRTIVKRDLGLIRSRITRTLVTTLVTDSP